MPTINLTPVADTLFGSNLTGDYGQEASVQMGEDNGSASVRRSLLKFDLTALPSDAVISAATLSLYMVSPDRSNNARTYSIFRMKRSWVEGSGSGGAVTNDGATWSTYDGVNAWTTAGAFDAADCEQSAIGTISLSASETLNQYKVITLTPTTKADLDLGFGWLMKCNTEVDDLYVFNSRHTGTNLPVLSITFTSASLVETTISPSQDTYIVAESPTANSDTDVWLFVGERDVAAQRLRSLIQFDLSSLPDAAIITYAFLRLYLGAENSSNARTMRVYRLKRAWVASQATWNIYSTGNNWQTAGGFGADDCEQTEIASRGFSPTETINAYKDIVFSGVASKAQLDLGNGWLLKMDTEVNDAMVFRSSSHGTAAQRPELIIQYTLPAIPPKMASYRRRRA